MTSVVAKATISPVMNEAHIMDPGRPVADENNLADGLACDLGGDIKPYRVVKTLSVRRNQTAVGVSSVGSERPGCGEDA